MVGGREAQYDTSEASAVVERAVDRPINQWGRCVIVVGIVVAASPSTSFADREKNVSGPVQCRDGAMQVRCSTVRVQQSEVR